MQAQCKILALFAFIIEFVLCKNMLMINIVELLATRCVYYKI